MNVILKCNPYTKKNSILIGDKEYSKESTLGKYTDIYVYQFGENFIYDLVNELNTTEINIEFYGSEYDYRELELITKIVNSKKNFRVKITDKKLVRELGKRKEIENLLVDIKNSEIKEFKEENLVEKIQHSLDKKIEIAVIAPMSSGKSTLINSLIGYKLMPSQTKACTATIVTLSNDVRARGFKIIKENERKCNKPVDIDVLTKLNEDNNINKLDIVGNILGLRNIENIRIVDTPGPNNAANENHRKTTMNYIKSSEKPIVLFVIDNNQQTSESVKDLIRTVADEMKRDGKIDEDRFLFVVNKCDSFKHEDNVEEIKKEMVKFIQGCGVKNPRIHFVSAYNALLARLILSNKELNNHERVSYSGSFDKTVQGLYTFHKESIFEERLKNSIELEIEEVFKIIKEKEMQKVGYDQLINTLALYDNGILPAAGFEAQIEVMRKEAEGRKEDKEQYDKAVAQMVLLTSGIIGVEKNIEDIVNQHKSIRLVGEIVNTCQNTIEAQNIKKKLRESIIDEEEKREAIEESIKIIKEKLNSKEVKEELENEINSVRFGNSFIGIINRVNQELRELQKKSVTLPKVEVDNVSSSNYVDREVAEKYLEEVSIKAESLKLNIETEYERFINVEIIEVGNNIINKYKEYLEVLMDNVTGIDSEVNKLVKVSIPNYNQFIENKTVQKSKSYKKEVDNPARQGFFGKLKFWKRKTIEVIEYEELNVINIDEIKKFTVDIGSVFQDLLQELIKKSNEEKEKVKETLLENLSVFQIKIYQNVESLNEMINNLSELEVAIDSEIETENKLDKIIKDLKSIISI